MEYSFSQTFGRGIIMLQDSPTPSFHSSNTDKKSRSIEDNDQSPVLQSYRVGQKVRDHSQTNSTDYFNKLSKQTRSYSHFTRTREDMHRQIKHVDGINERIANLINQLKRDCSINSRHPKEPAQAHGHRHKLNDANLSNDLAKRPDIGLQTIKQNIPKNVEREAKHKDNRISKKLIFEEDQKQKDSRDRKQNLKFRIQERLGYRDTSRNLEMREIAWNDKSNYHNQRLRVANSWGEEPTKQLIPKDSHKSAAFFRSREGKKQSWLKNKVKTIESEMQTNYQYLQFQKSNQDCHEYSYVEEFKPFKKTEQAINKIRSEDPQLKCPNCGLNKEFQVPSVTRSFQKLEYEQSCNSCTHQSINFEKKLKSISDKIQNYQRKFKNLSIGMENYNSKNTICSKNKDSFECETSISMPFKKANKYHHFEGSTKQGDKSQQTSYQLRLGTQMNSLPLYTQFHSEKGVEKLRTEQGQIKNKLINTQRSDRQRIEKGMSLKQRMSYKLATSSSALKIARQIQLDEAFRKSKKELSKLPDEVPGMRSNKWFFLTERLSIRLKTGSKIANCRQIFQLKDEEADPFFSIAIEDLQEYQQTINEAIGTYTAAEQHFRENLLRRLPFGEVSQIFGSKNVSEQIRVDQFTILISNATKINHKCRDVYLLFRRILTEFHENLSPKHQELLQQCISKETLVKILAVKQDQETTKKTLRRVKPDQLDIWSQSRNVSQMATNARK